MTELQKVVYEVLQKSPTAVQLQDVYSRVKRAAPRLCDDTVYPCPYCKQKHPLWQHKTAWALQYLKGKQLVRSAKRSYWEVTTKAVTEPTSAPPLGEESIHRALKRKIKEIGFIIGRFAKEEYPAQPYIYDVVWKEVEGLPRPCHVFEVQDKGAVDGALAKLQHARDIWKPKLFLVVTGEKGRRKVDSLLKPFLDGTFHGISKDTIVLTAETVDDIYKALTAHEEVIKDLLEV
jgi:putative lipoic acid-binding regulatory protein